MLSKGTKPLKKGVLWRIYETKKDMYGKRKQITSGVSKTIFKLMAGHYIIVASYKKMKAEIETTVIAGKVNEITVNLSRPDMQ